MRWVIFYLIFMMKIKQNSILWKNILGELVNCSFPASRTCFCILVRRIIHSGIGYTCMEMCQKRARNKSSGRNNQADAKSFWAEQLRWRICSGGTITLADLF